MHYILQLRNLCTMYNCTLGVQDKPLSSKQRERPRFNSKPLWHLQSLCSRVEWLLVDASGIFKVGVYVTFYDDHWYYLKNRPIILLHSPIFKVFNHEQRQKGVTRIILTIRRFYTFSPNCSKNGRLVHIATVVNNIRFSLKLKQEL